MSSAGGAGLGQGGPVLRCSTTTLLHQGIAEALHVGLALGGVAPHGALARAATGEDFVNAQPLAVATHADAQGQVMETQDPVGALQG